MANWQNTFHSYAIKAFCLLWAIWILIEYVSYHPYFANAITNNPYPWLILGFTGILAAFIGYYEYKRRKSPDKELKIRYRGIVIVALLIAFSVLILSAYIPSQPKIDSADLGSRLGYFVFFVSILLAGFFFILITAYGSGKLILDRLPIKYGREVPVLAIALGFSILGFLLLLLGLFGLLIPIIVWIIIGGAFLLGIRQNGQFAFKVFLTPKTVKLKSVWPVAVFFVLVLASSFYLISAVKAYPIGYDGTMVYLNQAALINDYGGLPIGKDAFNWAIIMSLGQILFGQTAISIFLSHLMGIACVFGIYFVARKWLSGPFALLAATIPFISPYFGFHAMSDEKTDLAFLFFGIASVLFLFPQKTQKKKPLKKTFSFLSKIEPVWISWALAGWIAGYAFGIKYTGLLLLISLGAIAFYRRGKERGALGYFLLAMGVLFISGVYRFAYLPVEAGEALIIGAVLCLGGLLSLGAFRRKLLEFKRSVFAVGIMLLLSLTCYSPWAIKNLFVGEEISFSSIVRGSEIGPDIDIEIESDVAEAAGVTDSLQELFPRHWDRLRAKRDGDTTYKSKKEDGRDTSLLTNYEKFKANPLWAEEELYDKGVYEEIVRYLGYENGLLLYTSIPYDLTTNVNFVDGNPRYLDLGFLFLAILPLLLLGIPGVKRSIARNSLVIPVIIIWVASNYYAVYGINGLPDIATILADRQSRFAAQPGGTNSFFWQLYEFLLSGFLLLTKAFAGVFKMAMALPFLAVIFILFAAFLGTYLLFRDRLNKMSIGFKTFMVFLLIYGFCWLLLGNAIVWYGFLFWVFAPILIIYYLANPDKFMGQSNAVFSRVFIATSLMAFIIGCCLMFFSSPYTGRDKVQLFHWQMVEFATNPNTDKSQVLQHYNPFFEKALDQLNKDVSEDIYCVNTYLRYHIQENDKRVNNDIVLSQFDAIVSRLDNDDEFIDILKDNGYRYILYDLGTPYLDQTPEKTLVAKCQRFLNMIVRSDQLELVVTDNYVYDNENGDKWVTLPNGERHRGRGDLVGQVISPGSFALYKIK